MSQEVPLLHRDLNCYISNQSELNQQSITQTSQDSIENTFNPQQVNESGVFNVSHSSYNKQDSFAVNFNSFCQEQKYNREFSEQEDLETPKCLRPSLKPVEQHIQETMESKKKVVKQ